NNTDLMVYQSEKMINENGDKFSEAEKTELNGKIDALKEALKGDDINLIKSRQEELTKQFNDISVRLYQEAAAAQQAAQGGAAGPDAGAYDAGAGANDGYYDAPYEDIN
ncbi:MAG: Hsp70 family protein, partial [Clostridia bacterium]|nr:Hsp70 family protein [Clostridia bacterium]